MCIRDSTGILQQRLFELAAFNGGLFEFFVDFWLHRQGMCIAEDLLLVKLTLEALHCQCFLALAARTYAGASAAAGAVENRNGNAELIAVHAGHRHEFRLGRSLCSFLIGHNGRTDDSMRANIGTEIALNTIFRYPNRYVNRNAAFFKSGSSLRQGAVLTADKDVYKRQSECPVGAISAGDGKYVIDADTCTDCGSCASVCPMDAPQAQ